LIFGHIVIYFESHIAISFFLFNLLSGLYVD
jgi:hypothetical protein